MKLLDYLEILLFLIMLAIGASVIGYAVYQIARALGW